MKTNLPVKSSINKDELIELEKKEKIRQIEEKILNRKDDKLIRVLKDLINNNK